MFTAYYTCFKLKGEKRYNCYYHTSYYQADEFTFNCSYTNDMDTDSLVVIEVYKFTPILWCKNIITRKLFGSEIKIIE